MTDPLVLTGKIVHGKGLGRTVGMPTANLCIHDKTVLPADGVYATRIRVGEKIFCSVTNIGRRPSVDHESRVTIETFIFDFDEDIYGENVVLEVHKFLRPVQKFQNLKKVQEQVQKDIEAAKEYFY